MGRILSKLPPGLTCIYITVPSGVGIGIDWKILIGNIYAQLFFRLILVAARWVTAAHSVPPVQNMQRVVGAGCYPVVIAQW